MKSWFLKFSVRDQLALLILAAALALYILWMLLLGPQAQARADLRARNLGTAELLQRVDVMASEIAARREQSAGVAPARGSLTATLNSTADRFALRINRLQPNSRGAVQLRFETVPLDNLLRWVQEVESGLGLRVEEVSINQTANPGFVTASLSVAAPG